MYDSLDLIADHMRNVGEQLVPYNFPQASPQLEDDLNEIKSRDVVVDGYNVILHFSKSNYDDHYLETLQVIGKNTSFLPFSLIAKVGRKFLGGHHLSLVEIYKDGRKIYCWSVTLNRRGCPIASSYEQDGERCTYEGFEYSYMDPSQVNFY